ncbi:hypothetical protein HK405_005916, partial [Cladochytrium tenue]
MADLFDLYPTLLISGLPPTITELDIVNVLNHVKMESKVVIERDVMTGAPRVRVIFRYQNDADRFFATVNGSMFLGSKVQLTFQDPNMNFSNTSGAKTIVAKHVPLGVTSLDFYDVARTFGKIISCKVMIDRSGVEAYALVQFENQDHADRFMQDMNGANFRGGLIALSWQFVKNAPYVYPTNRAPLPAAAAAAAKPNHPAPAAVVPMNVQVAVGAGWAMSTPATSEANRATSPTPGQVAGNHRSSWQNLPSTSVSPINRWSNPPVARPGSTAGWHYAASPAPDAYATSNVSRTTSPTPSMSAVSAASPVPSAAGSQAGSYRRTSTGSLTVSEAVAAGLDPRNLYIKNLDEAVDHSELFALFKTYGHIVSAKVMKDDGGKSKGFGFVSFDDEWQSRAAMESLDGHKVGSKPLVVCVAEPRSFREKKLQAIHHG